MYEMAIRGLSKEWKMQSDESRIGLTLLGFPLILGSLANGDLRVLSSAGVAISVLYIAISFIFATFSQCQLKYFSVTQGQCIIFTT